MINLGGGREGDLRVEFWVGCCRCFREFVKLVMFCSVDFFMFF